MQPPDPEEEAIKTRIVALEQEHRDLDAAISAMAAGTVPNHLQIQRLKKRKLALKDQIQRLYDSLLPDIIA
ncbi:MAG: YdcH family protein [Alphaproteobacteria bacterium]